MMISKQIEQKITTFPKGSLIFISDISKEFDYEIARKVLQRLTKKSILIRLSSGIYYYPKHDETFGIIIPTAEQIAKGIAKRDLARIIPTGSYALYKLGLSTQVPMNVVYLTDGSARKVVVGHQKISFKKTSPKNLAITHPLSNLIIQSIKELEKKMITDELIQKIKTIIIKSGEQDKIRESLNYAPVYIRNVVLMILNQINND